MVLAEINKEIRIRPLGACSSCSVGPTMVSTSGDNPLFFLNSVLEFFIVRMCYYTHRTNGLTSHPKAEVTEQSYPRTQVRTALVQGLEPGPSHTKVQSLTAALTRPLIIIILYRIFYTLKFLYFNILIF